MKIGERIFYTGDMANPEGWGKISDIKDDNWGLRYTVTLKDGRVFPSIFPAMFENSVGQRFKTENQVKQEQAEHLRHFERLYGKKEAAAHNEYELEKHFERMAEGFISKEASEQ